MRFSTAVAATAFVRASAELPPAGNLHVKTMTAEDQGLEPGSGVKSREYLIAYPEGASAGDQFPLVVYAHGFLAGGAITQFYTKHLKELAEYGYVVVAPKSCIFGCFPWFAEDAEDPRGADSSPQVGEGGILPCLPQWPTFVWENARAVTYARNQSDTGAAWAAAIDWDAGAAIVGHSMGGEAIVGMAEAELAKQYNIKAMVCEHCFPCKNTGDLVTVPSLWMTGTTDIIVPPSVTKGQYVLDTFAPKSWRNEKGRGHLEMMDSTLNPLNTYNPGVASHTAAFLNVWLKGDQGEFYDQIYGNSSTSFCGYAETKECEHILTSPVIV